MNVIDNYNWRYATKKFDPSKKVPNSNIESIKESITLAPTSYGLQLFKVFVVENQEIKEKLRKASFNQSQISDASHTFIFCNYTKVLESDIDMYIKNKSIIQNKPLSDIKGYGDFLKKTLLKKNDDEISIWATIQVDSCPIEGFESSKYNQILKLKGSNLNSTVVAAVGYRSSEDLSQFEKKIRKSSDELFETI